MELQKKWEKEEKAALRKGGESLSIYGLRGEQGRGEPMVYRGNLTLICLSPDASRDSPSLRGRGEVTA